MEVQQFFGLYSKYFIRLYCANQGNFLFVACDVTASKLVRVIIFSLILSGSHQVFKALAAPYFFTLVLDTYMVIAPKKDS